MPRLLKDLLINDVSSVDRGAGEGVRVMLMKRHAPEAAQVKKEDEPVISLAALRALRKDGAVDFDSAQAAQETREAADDMMCKLNEAICALNCAVCSIMYDTDVVDKVEAVNASFGQFIDYVGTIKPDDLEKTMSALTAEQINKQITDAVAAAMKDSGDRIAKLEFENSILKLSPAEFEFISKASDDEKKKFAAKSKEDRAKDMEDAKKAATTTLPPEIQKRLEQADRDSATVAKLLEESNVASFAKRAADLGIPGKGEVLRKARAGDEAAWGELEKTLQQMSAALKGTQKLSKAFDELGNGGGPEGGASALDQLNQKATELRKADPKLSKEQAFTKVYTDPANSELAAQEKQDRVAAISGR